MAELYREESPDLRSGEFTADSGYASQVGHVTGRD